MNFVVVPLCGDSSSLVWAEWVLQFPSFGCMLHQLLCLCKTRDDFTHHDSTEMSEDREFGFSGGTMSCKARRDTGRRGAGLLNCFREYVSSVCTVYGAESAHVWDILIDSLL